MPTMVIFPSVNVPVLSLQITEAEPNVSTAAIFRTKTSCCTSLERFCVFVWKSPGRWRFRRFFGWSGFGGSGKQLLVWFCLGGLCWLGLGSKQTYLFYGGFGLLWLLCLREVRMTLKEFCTFEGVSNSQDTPKGFCKSRILKGCYRVAFLGGSHMVDWAW